eukprot:CAMPEP_0183324024 /NCGR_PEP_ID=MMETSP0160_2-20130417/75928_1 /TAXON_ID=2839 ORGANISM="Odontella Sinensis, Strain Grunow 1884" /NCGR_SAMPLE_ID=MMETSP0160_2 /ASSEMBLY_ACC=CAM_ASM_000250 /LENGTH=503 /DNA_ID=CAMNT_0025491517 /DNA_START=26 /DNA_END=1537 /DNA_ORIENTATION=-
MADESGTNPPSQENAASAPSTGPIAATPTAEEETRRSPLAGLPAQDRADALFRPRPPSDPSYGAGVEILAPMVRASTAPLRSLALSYGADLTYTEEIIDRSITSCDRVVNDELGTVDYVKNVSSFSRKVKDRMRKRGEVPVVLRIVPEAERGRLIYQMGTGESNLALPAALHVQADVDGVDINMGCPKKFSVSGGMGSALLSDPKRACDIIKTLRRNLEVPVSAKIRLLKDDASTVDFVRSLVQAGANAIAIHAREVGDAPTTPAKWDRLENVVKVLKGTESVPIILNGDLYTRDDMIRMRRKTTADGIMLARPALYNTSIFRKPPPSAGGEWVEGMYGYDSPLLEDKTSVVRSYLEQSVRYASNPKNTKYVLCEFMNNRRTPPRLVLSMPQRYPEGQTIDAVCRCKTIEDLCKLWDVKVSASSAPWKGDVGEWFHRQASEGADRKYDDRYFLDPEGLRKEREAKAQEGGEEKKEAMVGEEDIGRGEGTATNSGTCAKRPRLD